MQEKKNDSLKPQEEKDPVFEEVGNCTSCLYLPEMAESLHLHRTVLSLSVLVSSMIFPNPACSLIDAASGY